MDLKSWADLEKHLNKKISEGLQMDVALDSRQLMRDHIQNDVYEVYTPYSSDGVTPHYERTFALIDSCITNAIGSNVIELKNTRTGENGENIPGIIEYGGHYKWGYKRYLDAEIGPRPFFSNTYKELANGRARLFMKNALIKRGLNVGK